MRTPQKVTPIFAKPYPSKRSRRASQNPLGSLTISRVSFSRGLSYLRVPPKSTLIPRVHKVSALARTFHAIVPIAEKSFTSWSIAHIDISQKSKLFKVSPKHRTTQGVTEPRKGAFFFVHSGCRHLVTT